mmetsp:Transcript_21622/g.57412  ORF Transcript_21622/g.57412 Transcript_21622/m.57412 type:complete len:122 (-) Transcript_21622:39-404(-)
MCFHKTRLRRHLSLSRHPLHKCRLSPQCVATILRHRTKQRTTNCIPYWNLRRQRPRRESKTAVWFDKRRRRNVCFFQQVGATSMRLERYADADEPMSSVIISVLKWFQRAFDPDSAARSSP